MKLRMNLLLTAALLITSTGVFGVGEKTLEIQRYPNEPMQLVDLKVSGQSVKDRIARKMQLPGSDWFTDAVSFTETDDWYKRVSLTFRNVSDKPVLGVTAIFLFKPASDKTLYGLQLTPSRNLRTNPLQRGDEVELTVLDDSRLQSTLQIMKEAGVDVNQCEVSFSLDGVGYNAELQWYRGNLLHPDPTTPNKWIPVNKRSQ